jgi:hypothetical protein
MRIRINSSSPPSRHPLCSHTRQAPHTLLTRAAGGAGCWRWPWIGCDVTAAGEGRRPSHAPHTRHAARPHALPHTHPHTMARTHNGGAHTQWRRAHTMAARTHAHERSTLVHALSSPVHSNCSNTRRGCRNSWATGCGSVQHTHATPGAFPTTCSMTGRTRGSRMPSARAPGWTNSAADRHAILYCITAEQKWQNAAQ